MKITFEIPDFVPPERIIHIMAGMEQIGYIEPHTRKVHVKISQCSQCGECCKNLKCEYFSDGKCRIPAEWKPFRCCVTEPRKIESCKSRYAE